MSNKFNYNLQIKGHELLKTLSVDLIDVILQHLIGFVLLNCFIYSRKPSELAINLEASKRYFGGFHLLSIFPKTNRFSGKQSMW